MKKDLLRLTRSLLLNCSRRVAASLVVVAGLSLAAPAANASPVAYAFSGVLDAADPSTGAAPGTPFSGTFTYDPAFQPGPLMIEGSTTYMFSNSLLGRSVPDTSRITLNVGGKPVFNEGDLNVGVTDTVNYHYTNPFTPSTNVGIGVVTPNLIMGLDLKSPSRSVDPTLALPTSLSLSEFPVATIELTTRGPNPIVDLYSGTITSLTPVPEPSVLALPALVGVGLVARRFGRRRSRERP